MYLYIIKCDCVLVQPGKKKNVTCPFRAKQAPDKGI